MADDPVQEVVDAVFRAGALLTAEFEAAARSVALTKQQAAVLRALAAPQPIAALATRTGVDPSNLTAVLRRLADAGLVEIGPDPADRRAKVVARTPDGNATAGRFEAELRAATVAVTRLDPRDRASLRDLLHKLTAGGG